MRQNYNMCQAGHRTHETKTVDTELGRFTIWDWERYRGFAGYCTGQDDVSMTLDLYGVWEKPDWDRARQLTGGGWVFDFGAHIGWYAVMLAETFDVLAVEADPVNCELLAINARNHGVHLNILNAWVADLDVIPPRGVRFIKSDVEGAENDVMTVCAEVVAADHPTLLVECSPEFDTYYPDLIDGLRAHGYKATVETTEITGATLGATQQNVWFE